MDSEHHTDDELSNLLWYSQEATCHSDPNYYCEFQRLATPGFIASIIRELQERRKADSEPVAWLLSGGGTKNVVCFDSGNAYADPLREVTPLYRHAQPDASHLSRICAESYQVVGALAEALNIFDDPCVIKALDNLSAQELVHEDVLPFSVDESAQPAPDKWIPVSDQMPEVGDIVLTSIGVGVTVGETECTATGIRFFTSVISGRELPATHWMPLPAGPQEVR
ncbi:TPA: DUF551 domain-containing protein [Klebsiella pneumoniae]|nr:DUF551 domain-containing protein [Klebsiella pneumoniae]HBT6668805.1 DUF551 domain-containing protein [Klebsiella pneumoniae]HBX4813951.1 DUF551 domain-containing protein [Klebsiella pneumoniae]HED2981289.1 DUF551 domain-containing protein [Klebsiella pneumoniae]